MRVATKLQYLSALRGLAILLVVLVHSSQHGARLLHIPHLLGRIIDHGARGVQLFFVLSAITLALSAYNRRDEKHPISNFYLRRLFRIAPLYWLGVIYYSFFPYHAEVVPSAGLVGSNFLFLHSLNPYWINRLVPGGWSISVEMLFYGIAPFLFARIQTFNRAVQFFLVTVLLNMAVTYSLQRFPLIAESEIWSEFLFYYILNQLPVFAAGIAIYFVITRSSALTLSPLTLCGGAILLLFGLWTRTNDLFPDPFHIRFGVGFALLTWALSKYSFPLLVNPVMTWIGDRSFSLYLVHFAVLYWLSHFGLADIIAPTATASALLNLAVRFLVVVAVGSLLSELTYRFLEVPAQEIGKRFIKKREVPPLYLKPEVRPGVVFGYNPYRSSYKPERS